MGLTLPLESPVLSTPLLMHKMPAGDLERGSHLSPDSGGSSAKGQPCPTLIVGIAYYLRTWFTEVSQRCSVRDNHLVDGFWKVLRVPHNCSLSLHFCKRHATPAATSEPESGAIKN